MVSHLFDLNLAHWGVLALYVLPALINFALFIYSAVYLTQNRINWTYSLFVLLLAITQIADGLMHMSNSVEAAEAWESISFTPWIFIVPIGILFVVSIGKSKLARRSWLYAVLFIPAIILLLLDRAVDREYEMVNHPTWGWVSNPHQDALNYIFYAYVTGGALLFPVLLWYYHVRSRKDESQRKRLLLLAIGVTIPAVGGIIGEVLFPLVLAISDVPLATPLMTAFSVCSFIAITRFNMLDFSPRNQWDRILETLREGIIIADNNRRIMYANPSMCNLLEYTPEELIGKEADTLILKNSLHGTQFTAEREFQMATKSGELIWVVTNISACIDDNGKRTGTIWTVTDVHDLTLKNIEVKRSEKRLNRAQEVAHVGHWDLDFATGVAQWSTEACRIYGIPPNERIQSFETWISYIHPEDLSLVMLEIQRAQENYEDADFEHRILLRDGTVKYLRSISKFEFNGKQTKPSGMYGVCQDITEIKLAQERLTITTNELETYIYKSSHDLHAPLSSILGLINVARREITDPVASQYLAMVENQAKKLESIRTEFIKAMLIKDAAKFDEQIHLNQMIPEILDTLRYSHGFSRMNINVNIPDDQPLHSNSFLVKTILQNLIENSVKYQDYSQAVSTLNIEVVRDDNNAKIIIADNGVGIDHEMQERIFEMYFRATQVGQGSGLGLYLVKKAVDKLNARLQLRSHPGQGTTFTLSLAQAG